jgi:hypothetical protein
MLQTIEFPYVALNINLFEGPLFCVLNELAIAIWGVRVEPVPPDTTYK